MSICLRELQYSQKDLDELRNQLLQIRSTMKDGKLPDESGNTSPGQDLVVPLLERCLRFADMVEERYVPRGFCVCATLLTYEQERQD